MHNAESFEVQQQGPVHTREWAPGSGVSAMKQHWNRPEASSEVLRGSFDPLVDARVFRCLELVLRDPVDQQWKC